MQNNNLFLTPHNNNNPNNNIMSGIKALLGMENNNISKQSS